MARRSDHSREQIREMTLAASEEIIATQGHQALSARKVAGAIGYTVGTLYLVFENLDDLILQVNGRTLDRLYELIVEDQRHCADAEACLFQLGHSYIRFADAEPYAWQLIFEHRLADDREPPDWYQEKIAHMFALVEERIAQLAAHQSDKEIAQAARALWGGVHGICILAITHTLGAAGVDSVQAITYTLMNNFVKGFVSTPSNKQ